MAQRRAKGEGSIYLDESRQIWIGELTENGERIKFSSGKGGTRADVVKKMQKWRLEHQQGYAQTKKITLDIAMTSWLTTIKKPVLKPASYDRLESTIVCQILPRIGDKDPKSLTDTIIKEELLDAMEKEKLSVSSRKKAFDAMNAYLKYAAFQGHITKNPMGMMKPPSASGEMDIQDTIGTSAEKEVIALANDEIKKLYAVSKIVWKTGKQRFLLNDAFIFIMNTGLRMGEALALKWNDINFDACTVSVTKNLIRVVDREATGKNTHKIIIQNTPKSKKSRRVVPINRDALTALKALQSQPGAINNGYVIHDKNGGPITPANFQKALTRSTNAAGIRDIGVHALRHTYATKLFEAGVDVKIISELLGHSSTEITYRVYIHVIDSIKQNAVTKALDLMPSDE